MSEVPYALALAAGMLAAVNPCGFALLPVYLSFLVLDDQDPGVGGRGRAVGRAMVLTGAMTVGFVLVFGLFALLAAPVANVVAQRLPWISVVLGLALLVAGGWLVAGRQLPAPALPGSAGRPVTRRFWSMTLFGGSYAVASLGCTIGPFLAIVAASFRAGSVGAGLGLFATYAAGMALVVGTAAVAVALAQVSLVRAVRRLAPVLGRAAGALMILVGAYVAWYGGYELRVFGGGDGADPIVDTAAGVQAAIAGWIDRLGPGGIAGILAMLLLVAVIAATVRRRLTVPAPRTPPATGPAPTSSGRE
jgi:cytochrome c-type biogenesis protein